VEELARKNYHVHVVITSAGKKVMAEELGTSDLFYAMNGQHAEKDNITVWDNDDFTAPFMSGSSAPDALIVIPCSAGKLAALSNGISTNLLERTGDVVLKEGKQLILVVRETPFSIIHLQNMLSVAKAGAQIVPAIPAFYHHPKTVSDVVDFIVGKVLNLLNIKHKLFKRWKAK
jgi:4-hydroxy-3-polyprenylbenzoate decarboxylase